MGHDGGVVVLVGQLHGLECLREGADLVYFHQDGIGRAQLDACRQALLVGDEEVVPHQLHLSGQPPRELLPAVPVILRQGVLDGYNRKVLGQFLKVGYHLVRAADDLLTL